MWVNELINRVVTFVVRPVTVNPYFFILLFFLFVVPDIFSFLVYSDLIPIIVAATGFLFCYMLLLPVVMLPSSFRKIYKFILLLLGLVIFALQICSIVIYERSVNLLTPDMLAAILATNQAEAQEFVMTYFNWNIALLVLALIALLLIFFYKLNRITLNLNVIPRIILFLFIVLSISIVFLKYENVSKIVTVQMLIKGKVPDLKEYRQDPILVKCGDTPENIVLIIGESFSKYHSSLYGYEKQTNPLLERMVADSALYVYKNVESLALSTIPCIKSIMSSYRNEYADSIEWYKCLTIIDVMKENGYEISWLSNQSKRGVHDNEVGRYAELCDKEYFIGDIYSGLERSNFDEELLPYIDHCITDNGMNFIVIQLMGSHAAYNKRYPVEYERFTVGDYEDAYKELSDDKKQLVAEYDNSVLYNDSVVSEIMNSFAEKEAVVFYFSDHGEDVFMSSKNFIGHGNYGNAPSEEVIKQIPFMVYTTDKFRERFPQIEERIKQAVDTPYRTDSVMYTIMDVAGIDSVNGVSYKHKSLFK